MGVGWIKLSRAIEEHWLWDDKPFSRGQAWIDLLMMANYKPVMKMVRGRLVTYETGTVYHSQSELAERWGWDRRKVSRFLKLLEDEKMCTVKRAPYGTVVFVENYRKFQGECTTDGTTFGTADSTTDGATDGTQVKKYKEVKEDKDISVAEIRRNEGEDLAKVNRAAGLTSDQEDVLFSYETTYGTASSRAVNQLCEWTDEYGPEKVIEALEKAMCRKVQYPLAYMRKILESPGTGQKRNYRDRDYDGVVI